MAKKAPEEVERNLRELDGWESSGMSIRRTFAVRSFPDAIAFAVRVGFVAESADHHPEILIEFKRVTLTYSTHSEGGVTDKDFDGAGKATALAKEMGGS